jgi:hypothetical protein
MSEVYIKIFNTNIFLGSSGEYIICLRRLAAGQWFSLGTPVSSTNKTDSHDIAKILLKVGVTSDMIMLFVVYLLS